MSAQFPIVRGLALIAGTLAIAGCGSSSNKPGGSSTSSQHSKLTADAIAMAQCMRSHGVPNFPDPDVSGNGISVKIQSGSGLNPQSPSFQSAQKTCRHFLPGPPGGANQAPSAATEAKMLAVAQCLRAHGITGFPDPTTHPPSSPPSGTAGIMENNGVAFVIPSSINIQSPAFKQAATTCHFGGPAGGP